MIRIDTLIVGSIETNCYIVSSEDTGEGFIVDPGGSSGKIISFLKKSRITPTGIILTHFHYDHIASSPVLRETFDVPIIVHSMDEPFLKKSTLNFSEMFSDPIAMSADKLIEEGDLLKLGDSALRVLHTPGHSEGSISLLSEDCKKSLFCGDLFFREAIGRVDLPGGDYDKLVDSIKRILEFPNETTVYPGHGPPTTIGSERGFLQNL